MALPTLLISTLLFKPSVVFDVYYITVAGWPDTTSMLPVFVCSDTSTELVDEWRHLALVDPAMQGCTAYPEPSCHFLGLHALLLPAEQHLFLETRLGPPSIPGPLTPRMIPSRAPLCTVSSEHFKRDAASFAVIIRSANATTCSRMSHQLLIEPTGSPGRASKLRPCRMDPSEFWLGTPICRPGYRQDEMPVEPFGSTHTPILRQHL